MRKFILNRNFVYTLALWMAFISIPPSNAFAMPSDSISSFAASSARDAQIGKIMAVLSRPEARAHLALMGINQKELQSKLSQMDDGDLAVIAEKADTVKAAGSDALAIIIVLLVIAILVVLLMKLSNKTIEIKDQK